MAYPKLLTRTLVAAALAMSLPQAALAQEAPAPNPAAESLNEQGKELYKNKDFQGAAAKFREANSIQPDARYYFNLCATLEKAGDLNGALEACDQVYSYTPNDELKGKTGARAATIRQAIRQRDAQTGTNPPPPDPNNPSNNPPPPDPNNPTVIPPGPDVSKPAPGEYNWAFGGEAGPIVANDMFGDADTGGFLRLYADKAFSSKFGGRAFLGFGGLSGTDVNGVSTRTVSIFELGVAAFTNVKLARNLYVTPMLGAQIAGFDDSTLGTSSTSAGTFGVNLGVPISLVLGGGKHVIYINPAAISYYLPQTASDSSSDDFDGGTTYMITFGYQMRLQKGERLPGFVVLE